ncbi:Uncharacterized conserved protein, DUF1800 family [Noviherbaspirillum humi]|uniref:Uncharacterized conserved protein, DUF1800 family n=1 Tax=Noviherbaspirillum humi TaxID=1688639 RepID=A0A239LJ83_9BURK|nr:DUF1800 domain-containing protein [Noviherbaspirillum humi]SNT29962.1 Uncharacterized conserved protein, DUF1800 family [Noviherbaspirillum humi]
MKRFRALLLLTAAFLLSGLAGAAEPAPEQAALHVLNRLGYGPRPGDLEEVMRIGVDRYVEMQLNPSSIALSATLAQRLAALPIESQSAGDALAALLQARDQDKQAGKADRGLAKETQRRIVEQTVQARLLRAVESPRQLEEVMVDFWFNHFNVFMFKGLDPALVASYERDAIRPHAFGNFRDLLGATARHPAMLFYLDNWLSSAANDQPLDARGRTIPAARRIAGLNENYARELMELHTLGADGGYTEQDVTELARMFTGWTFKPQELARGGPGFRFEARRHDGGDKVWLGRRIAAQGQQEGEIALDVLALHPSTARRLAFKLAQYFVADQPPPALVERLARRYLDSGGEIRPVLRVLFSSSEFRNASAVGAKFKTPYRFVVSAMRAAALPVDNARPIMGALNRLGMPLFGCATPDGYKNTEDAWLNPDALARRLDFAALAASGRLASAGMMTTQDMDPPAQAWTPVPESTPAAPPTTRIDSGSLLHTLGPGVSAATRDAILRNPPRLQAAMVLGSPDFMRY